MGQEPFNSKLLLVELNKLRGSRVESDVLYNALKGALCAVGPGEPKLHPGIMNTDPLIASRYIKPGEVLGGPAETERRLRVEAAFLGLGKPQAKAGRRWFWFCVIAATVVLAFMAAILFWCKVS